MSQADINNYGEVPEEGYIDQILADFEGDIDYDDLFGNDFSNFDNGGEVIAIDNAAELFVEHTARRLNSQGSHFTQSLEPELAGNVAYMEADLDTLLEIDETGNVQLDEAIIPLAPGLTQVPTSGKGSSSHQTEDSSVFSLGLFLPTRTASISTQGSQSSSRSPTAGTTPPSVVSSLPPSTLNSPATVVFSTGLSFSRQSELAQVHKQPQTTLAQTNSQAAPLATHPANSPAARQAIHRLRDSIDAIKAQFGGENKLAIMDMTSQSYTGSPTRAVFHDEDIHSARCESSHGSPLFLVDTAFSPSGSTCASSAMSPEYSIEPAGENSWIKKTHRQERALEKKSLKPVGRVVTDLMIQEMNNNSGSVIAGNIKEAVNQLHASFANKRIGTAGRRPSLLDNPMAFIPHFSGHTSDSSALALYIQGLLDAIKIILAEAHYYKADHDLLLKRIAILENEKKTALDFKELPVTRQLKILQKSLQTKIEESKELNEKLEAMVKFENLPPHLQEDTLSHGWREQIKRLENKIKRGAENKRKRETQATNKQILLDGKDKQLEEKQKTIIALTKKVKDCVEKVQQANKNHIIMATQVKLYLEKQKQIINASESTRVKEATMVAIQWKERADMFERQLRELQLATAGTSSQASRKRCSSTDLVSSSPKRARQDTIVLDP